MQSNPSVCALGIQINKANTYLLGNVFMRNYYVIFDDDQKRVGMSPQVGSDVAEI